MSQPESSYFPPLKALRAFEAAARRGGFALGAEEIGITPSAVSHQIRNLERDLDIALFDRHAGRATLTPAGAAYFEAITQAFSNIAEATRGIKPYKHQGRLVVASGPSFAARWLQPRLPAFLNLHPNVILQVATFSNVMDLEHLEFDLAISYRKPPGDLLDVAPLLTETLQPLCSPELRRNLAIKEITDLKRATLIHSDNAVGWPEYLSRIGYPKLEPLHNLWIDRSAIAIDTAVKGAGFVLESEILASQEIESGSLVFPFDDALKLETSSYYMVKKRNLKRKKHARIFEDWFREEIEALKH